MIKIALLAVDLILVQLAKLVHIFHNHFSLLMDKPTLQFNAIIAVPYVLAQAKITSVVTVLHLLVTSITKILVHNVLKVA